MPRDAAVSPLHSRASAAVPHVATSAATSCAFAKDDCCVDALGVIQIIIDHVTRAILNHPQRHTYIPGNSAASTHALYATLARLFADWAERERAGRGMCCCTREEVMAVLQWCIDALMTTNGGGVPSEETVEVQLRDWIGRAPRVSMCALRRAWADLGAPLPETATLRQPGTLTQIVRMCRALHRSRRTLRDATRRSNGHEQQQQHSTDESCLAGECDAEDSDAAWIAVMDVAAVVAAMSPVMTWNEVPTVVAVMLDELYNRNHSSDQSCCYTESDSPGECPLNGDPHAGRTRDDSKGDGSAGSTAQVVSPLSAPPRAAAPVGPMTPNGTASASTFATHHPYRHYYRIAAAIYTAWSQLDAPHAAELRTLARALCRIDPASAGVCRTVVRARNDIAHMRTSASSAPASHTSSELLLLFARECGQYVNGAMPPTEPHRWLAGADALAVPRSEELERSRRVGNRDVGGDATDGAIPDAAIDAEFWLKLSS